MPTIAYIKEELWNKKCTCHHLDLHILLVKALCNGCDRGDRDINIMHPLLWFHCAPDQLTEIASYDLVD